MSIGYKQLITRFLGEIPLTAEFYFQFKKNNEPGTRYSLKNLKARLPKMLPEIEAGRRTTENPKKILVFTSLHYWIEEAATLALYFAASAEIGRASCRERV